MCATYTMPHSVSDVPLDQSHSLTHSIAFSCHIDHRMEAPHIPFPFHRKFTEETNFTNFSATDRRRVSFVGHAARHDLCAVFVCVCVLVVSGSANVNDEYNK